MGFDLTAKKDDKTFRSNSHLWGWMLQHTPIGLAFGDHLDDASFNDGHFIPESTCRDIYTAGTTLWVEIKRYPGLPEGMTDTKPTGAMAVMQELAKSMGANVIVPSVDTLSKDELLEFLATFCLFVHESDGFWIH